MLSYKNFTEASDRKQLIKKVNFKDDMDNEFIITVWEQNGKEFGTLSVVDSFYSRKLTSREVMFVSNMRDDKRIADYFKQNK